MSLMNRVPFYPVATVILASLLTQRFSNSAEQYRFVGNNFDFVVDVSNDELTLTSTQAQYQYAMESLVNPVQGYRTYRAVANPNQWIAWPDDIQYPAYKDDGSNSWKEIPGTIDYLGSSAPVAPQTVVQTQTIAGPALAPVTIRMTNSHHHSIVVLVVDRQKPKRRPREYKIVPGGEIQHTIQRDGGAVEQIVEVTTEGEILRVLSERQLAPQPLYDIVVYEQKVVSMYLDRTGKDRLANPLFLPPATREGVRSIGVFQLPAGDELDDASYVDPYADAVDSNNPGAAAHYRLPVAASS